MRATTRTTARTLPTLAALAATTLLGTAACGAESGSGTAPTTAAQTTASGATTTSASPSASPTPGARMTEGISFTLVLTRTGGIGGLKDRLELRPDGTYTVVSQGKAPVTRQLSEGQLAAIVNALQAADLPHLATQSPTERRSDQFTYVLRYDGTTFTTTETTAPETVRPLLEELGALFSSPGSTR
ncbi:protealysin inhibitor emfourin [Angustibacter sp. Root456]|uniref:protealysin inhibitor emfourin n=1 Tax=Angustibacter sp. Root456 TaxID=1736539 RepID=UPI0006F3856D|nr:protealysin inhibitor emfourin [Angustibacter sp. Root456]KQX65766.1 hypothetical protein ASD06_09150 [Angustibacter sp. Root456]